MADRSQGLPFPGLPGNRAAPVRRGSGFQERHERGDTVDVQLLVRRVDPAASVPSYAHPGDAGLDLSTTRTVRLAPGQRTAVPTGLAVAIPAGWVGLVHPRSGLARRHGVTVANAPGTIDAGYRGELQVLLINLGDESVELEAGDRIAQLLLQQVGHAQVIEVEDLDTTARGSGGFGSTGSGAR
jgi:dUTP pyrophosphatase